MVTTKLMNNKDVDNPQDGVGYFRKLPEWVRVKYYQGVNSKCQLCHKPMLYKDMEVHRLTRKSKGGLYTYCKLDHPSQNCMFIHDKCHKLLHSNESGHGSHSY